jgi:hypothetical protein
MAPLKLALAGRPPTGVTLTLRFAEPVPDDGVTWSHGWFDVAVHDTVPEPD